MKISIQASAIRAATICAAKKDIRYYLQGVYINVAHRDYATVCGTDGHVLFAGRAAIDTLDGQQSAPWSMIVPLDVAKKIDKKAHAVILESLPDGTYLLDGTRFAPLDGRFPDYRRVIPRMDQIQAAPVAPGHFDYALIVRGNDALNTYYGGKVKVYPLEQRGNDSAVMHNGENVAVVVVMPMRIKDVAGYQGFNENLPDALAAAPVLAAA
jgi:DNA polymerase-3 subunit beta